jgi:extradiol dioxygenase family protein
MQSIFHLALNVTDFKQARIFYGQLLGCKEGRSTKTWIDFNFFGHQISLHLGEPFKVKSTGNVENNWVPMPHFGVVLNIHQWKKLAKKLENSGLNFILTPFLRFKGKKEEQYTMFFNDPFGNPIEIKGIKNIDALLNHE